VSQVSAQLANSTKA